MNTDDDNRKDDVDKIDAQATLPHFGDEDLPEESMEEKEGKVESIFEDEPTYYNQTSDQIPSNPPTDPGE